MRKRHTDYHNHVTFGLEAKRIKILFRNPNNLVSAGKVPHDLGNIIPNAPAYFNKDSGHPLLDMFSVLSPIGWYDFQSQKTIPELALIELLDR